MSMGDDAQFVLSLSNHGRLAYGILYSNVARRGTQELPKTRIPMNIAVLIAMGVLLLSAASCREEPTETLTAQPTATPSPTTTSTMSPDDTVSSTDPQPSPEPTLAVPDDMVKALAPIESVEIRVAESDPPQYFVDVVSGLPNACVEFYGYEEHRVGGDIATTVYNLEPAPNQQIACAEIYTMHEFVVSLGSDFQPGETYTLSVNSTTTTFVAE